MATRLSGDRRCSASPDQDENAPRDLTGHHGANLQRLIDSGYVVAETERRTTRGRPRTLYTAATGEDAASTPIAAQRAQDAARRGDLLRRVHPTGGGEQLPPDALHQLDAPRG